MSRFKLSEKNIGNLATIHVEDDFYGSSIEIAQIGATLMSFVVKTNNGFANIVDGYQAEEEFNQGIGARNWLLAPYSNRIKNNQYTFQSTTYSHPEPVENMIHGFVHDKKFDVQEIKIEDTYAEFSLVIENLGDFLPDFYPFRIWLSVKYQFSGTSLKLNILARNNDTKDAPFCCGWHPYFRVNEKPIDSYQLTIPAERVVMTDANLFPYDHEMAYTHVSNLPGSDFRKALSSKKRILGRRQLNVCYSHLIKNRDGFIVSNIEHPETGNSINLKQPRGVLYCFTGDELMLRPRYSIALEPVEFITNSFNRPELAELITLQPGASRQFTVDVEFL